MNLCEWKTQDSLIGYETAQKWMRNRVALIQNYEAPECIWLLEHPPLYTLGTSAKMTDVFPSATLSTFQTGRGGQVTYHGPGQRVVYLMLDLKTRKQDVKWYVFMLEEWVIQALHHFNVVGERRHGRVGIWVQKNGLDHKIAALGIRVQRWVTSHGLAINVNTDLTPYQNIIPCGLAHYGVTSLTDLGVSASLAELDEVLRATNPFCI